MRAVIFHEFLPVCIAVVGAAIDNETPDVVRVFTQKALDAVDDVIVGADVGSAVGGRVGAEGGGFVMI